MGFDIKRAMVTAIERTNDPLAAIKLNEAFKSVSTVGQMFTVIADKEKTADMQAKLLQAFPEDMDNIARDPNFLCALCACLSQSLIEFGKDLGK